MMYFTIYTPSFKILAPPMPMVKLQEMIFRGKMSEVPNTYQKL